MPLLLIFYFSLSLLRALEADDKVTTMTMMMMMRQNSLGFQAFFV